LEKNYVYSSVSQLIKFSNLWKTSLVFLLPPPPGPRTPLVEQAMLSLLCSGLSIAATWVVNKGETIVPSTAVMAPLVEQAMLSLLCSGPSIAATWR
jgi:hypothetical protein